MLEGCWGKGVLCGVGAGGFVSDFAWLQICALRGFVFGFAWFCFWLCVVLFLALRGFVFGFVWFVFVVILRG